MRLTGVIISVTDRRHKMQNIIGIDVSKDKHDVILLSEGRKYHKTISNDLKGFQYLERWLGTRQVAKVHACMEATGQYGEELAEYLYERDHLVSVVNPARIKRYGESKLHRNKTDKADAGLIAEFCFKEKPGKWEPLSPEMKHLRALIRRLRSLKANLHQENNRLKSGEKDEWVINDLTIHIEFLQERIKAAEKEIKEFVNQTPSLKSQRDLLTSIPGIGDLTACTLLAEIGDFSAFESAPQLAAFAGLNPKGHRSGSSVNKKARISKEGRAELRCCLYMPAVVALSCNPVIQALSKRLRERHLQKMEIVVASMRKLLHLAYGVIKTQLPFDPNYGAQFDFSS
jgi:transposase